MSSGYDGLFNQARPSEDGRRSRLRNCPACNLEADMEALYCSYCGGQMPVCVELHKEREQARPSYLPPAPPMEPVQSQEELQRTRRILGFRTPGEWNRYMMESFYGDPYRANALQASGWEAPSEALARNKATPDTIWRTGPDECAVQTDPIERFEAGCNAPYDDDEQRHLERNARLVDVPVPQPEYLSRLPLTSLLALEKQVCVLCCEVQRHPLCRLGRR